MKAQDDRHIGHAIGWAQVKFRPKRPQFWRVCFDCHAVVEGPFKKGKVPDADSIPLWSRKQWYEWRGVHPPASKAQRICLKSEWRHRYKAYLQSEKWKRVRDARLSLDKGLCVKCGNKAEHVHHLSYRNLGDEPMEDLMSVCRPCHSEIHGRSI